MPVSTERMLCFKERGTALSCNTCTCLCIPCVPFLSPSRNCCAVFSQYSPCYHCASFAIMCSFFTEGEMQNPNPCNVSISSLPARKGWNSAWLSGPFPDTRGACRSPGAGRARLADPTGWHCGQTFGPAAAAEHHGPQRQKRHV